LTYCSFEFKLAFRMKSDCWPSVATKKAVVADENQLEIRSASLYSRPCLVLYQPRRERENDCAHTSLFRVHNVMKEHCSLLPVLESTFKRSWPNLAWS
jgi:hypothetical protein